MWTFFESALLAVPNPLGYSEMSAGHGACGGALNGN